MRFRTRGFARLCCLTLAFLGLAPGLPAAQGIPAYTLDDDVTLRPDFSTVETVRLERRLERDADLSALQTTSVPFRDGLDKVEILEAFTLKRDGSMVPVTQDAIQLQTVGVPGLPATVFGFSDLRRMVVIFPALERGDRTVLRARITGSTSTLPGGYTARFTVPAGEGGAEARVTLHLPPGQPLGAAAQGFAEDPPQPGGTRTWRYAAAARHREAGVLVSTWPDAEALAAAMVPGFRDAMTVTPELQALADRLTDGVDDRVVQVRRIYEWVSREIHYVDILTGLGGVVPVPAEAVLRARYGDCKGHAVLFATLLKAKGITAWPVLIGLGADGYAITTPPTLVGFDHAIVHVPELDLWADTTAARVPFGSLPFQEYGKPVLVMSSDAPRVARTPILAPGAASFDVETDATLESSGAISGATRMVATGPFAFGLRMFAASGGREDRARQRLRMLGYDGAGSYRAHDVGGFSDAFTLEGRFQIAPRPDRLSGTSFRLPPGLTTTPRPGMFLLGSLPDADPAHTAPIPCWSGEISERLSLHLPQGKRVRSLPPPLALDTPDLRYRSTWSVTGDVVAVQRRMITHVTAALCQGQARAEDAAALVRIRADYLSGQIALEDAEPAAPSPAQAAPQPAAAPLPAAPPPASPSTATPQR
ncbi:MAG: DUF3857 domain-containing protein [Rhodospirillales bacterium]|nr:DUF3857 domain-containing protein [Rhodospirillales bacterium]